MMESDQKKGAVIVNLFGGPGAGKSTMAAGLFSELKWRGINCELATEYAKEKVWEESYAIFENQIYIFGKQLQRVLRVKDKVDVVITDSPIILIILYNKLLSGKFDELIMEIFNSFENLNYYIVRKKKYMRKGRLQTLDEALELDERTEKLLKSNNVKYSTILGERASTEILADEIVGYLENKN